MNVIRARVVEDESAEWQSVQEQLLDLSHLDESLFPIKCDQMPTRTSIHGWKQEVQQALHFFFLLLSQLLCLLLLHLQLRLIVQIVRAIGRGRIWSVSILVLLVSDDVDIVLILMHDLRLNALGILLLVFKVADHGFLSVARHCDRFDLVHVLWRFEIPEHLLLLIG